MAELADEFERLMGELALEGRLDSSGHFTIDFFKGSEKLRQYQLADPSQYILKLVQAAVASRADSIHVESDRSCLRFSYNGQPLRAEELEGLAESLLHRERFAERPHLIHLAAAVNAALGWGVETVIVESWMDGQGVALLLTRQAQRAGRVVGEGVRPNGIRILIRRQALALVSPEERWLRSRVAFCPIPIRLNGKHSLKPDFGRPPLPPFLKSLKPVINALGRLGTWRQVVKEKEGAVPWWVQIWNVDDYVFGECHRRHHLIEKRVTCVPCYDSFALPEHCEASILEQEVGDWQPHSDDKVGSLPGIVHCRRALAVELDMATYSRLLLIQDGVVLVEKQMEFPNIRGGVALLTCAGLKSDLSHLNVVEEQAYLEVVKRLESDLRALRLNLSSRLAVDNTLVPLGSYVQSYLPPR